MEELIKKLCEGDCLTNLEVDDLAKKCVDGLFQEKIRREICRNLAVALKGQDWCLEYIKNRKD